MRILILGGDGYLGWPTAMRLAARGDAVMVVDNYLRRTMARETGSEPLVATPNLEERAKIHASITGLQLSVEIGDCKDQRFMGRVFTEFRPDAVVHYAEQPSAPYSMMGYEEARRTLHNNIGATFNVIWSVMEHAPECHIVKLGTMGEYGTPNIDTEEGWLDVEHNVAGVPLTLYGSGGQTRGFLNIEDTLQCVELALRHPAAMGELRIMNQFTELFTVRELAEKVAEVGNRLGLRVCVTSIANPRKEREEHYYNPQHRALLDLGLEPHYSWTTC